MNPETKPKCETAKTSGPATSKTTAVSDTNTMQVLNTGKEPSKPSQDQQTEVSRTNTAVPTFHFPPNKTPNKLFVGQVNHRSKKYQIIVLVCDNLLNTASLTLSFYLLRFRKT